MEKLQEMDDRQSDHFDLFEAQERKLIAQYDLLSNEQIKNASVFGSEKKGFYWLTKGKVLICKKCNFRYSPTKHSKDESCPKIVLHQMHKNVTYDVQKSDDIRCGGILEWEYIFLESPNAILEIVTRAIAWQNKNKPETDLAGQEAWNSIYTYNGAMARKPQMLRQLQIDMGDTHK